MYEQIQKRKQKIKRISTDDMWDEVQSGNKFIILQEKPNVIPRGYKLIDMRYKDDSFLTLVPKTLVTYMGNPGEGDLESALDELSDFYGDVENFEEDNMMDGSTSVQGVDWAMTSKDAYQIYLVNMLTKDGNDYDAAAMEQLDINDNYVDERLRSVAALCLEKTVEEIQKQDLSRILKHVSIKFDTKVKTVEQRRVKVKCWAGSHYEIKHEYRDFDVTRKETQSKNYESIEGKVSDLFDEVHTYRKGKGSKISKHDDALLREYTNLAYIAKENPKAQLDVCPPGRDKKKDGTERV